MEDHLWTERHRPSSLDEVIGHEESIERLKQWLDDDSVPNILLKGPAGTGKTATVVAFAKDKYGDDWRGNLIQMNASDDRGIDVVREQIKKQAAEAPSGDYEYKIIYLDECDNLTKDAQQALRRTMEQYADRTRFFMSCNYVNKLIDPIQSRCVAIPFERLSDGEIKELVTRILDEEGVSYEDDAVELIVDSCNGDARRVVNTLQSSVVDGELTTDVVDIISGTVDRDELKEIVTLAMTGEMEEAQDRMVTNVLPNVVDHSSLAGDFMNVLQYHDEIPDDVRWFAIHKLGEVEDRVESGRNPHVQWNSFLATMPVARHMSIPNYDQ